MDGMPPRVAAFLLDLVNRQTVSAAADDLVELAELITEAKRWLAAVLSS